MSELGLDERESDARPVLVGSAAMDADARISHSTSTGKSGEAQGDHTRLNLGGLSICPAIDRTTRWATAGDGLGEVSRGHSSGRPVVHHEGPNLLMQGAVSLTRECGASARRTLSKAVV